MTEARVTIRDGEAAVATAYTDGVLRLICALAFPPGKPVALLAELGDERAELQGRSAGSKRRADGRYDVVVRLVSLKRTDRERLERFFTTQA